MSENYEFEFIEILALVWLRNGVNMFALNDAYSMNYVTIQR